MGERIRASIGRKNENHGIDIGKNSSTVLVATNFIVAAAPFIDSFL